MLTGAAIRNSLGGAWAVMNGRAEGLQQLDLSIGGFWRSFAAVFLILPFAVLALLGERSVMAASGEAVVPLTGGIVAAHGFTVLLDWVAFPLVFAALARPLGLSRHYVPFIVARNWAAVISTAIAALAHALLVVGIVPAAAAPFLLIVVLGIVLRFAYFVARTALAVPLGIAIPIVVLDLLVSLTVEAAVGPDILVQSPG